MNENYEFKSEVFRVIFEDINKHLELYLSISKEDCLFHKQDDVRVYINKDGSYFSFDVADKSFVIHYRLDDKDGIYKIEFGKDNKDFFDDRVEMLIVDALESSLQFLQEETHKEKSGYSKLIDRLFSNMIKRRELKAQKVANDTKYQIVQKDLVKTYI